jgi:putative molybdopterin biosynthesis protein
MSGTMVNRNSMNAQDVADTLNIAKNTVYELVKRGELNSYTIGRKMRFTADDVEEYIKKSKKIQKNEKDPDDIQEPGYDEFTPSNPGFIISGQDIMLDVLSSCIDQQGGGLCLRSYIGSYDSLVNLYKGRVNVASSHLWDGDTGEYNVPYVKRLLPGIPAVIIHLTCRTQGFYVKKGNPLDIRGWEDIMRDDITIINREKGAGSRVLLDEHLRLMGVVTKDISGYGRESHSHLTVATTVARGGADLAVGDMKMIRQVSGIDFIPLQKERYELVVKEEDMGTKQVDVMLQIIRSREFRQEFSNVDGYDTKDMGKIVNGID